MTAFMLTMFVIHLLGVGINLSDLVNKTYPFTKTRTKSDDVVGLLVAVGIAIWAGVLIFN